MIHRNDLARRLCQACQKVIAAQDELTEIDSRFGDADHGITMTKICRAIEEASAASEGGIRTLLDDAACAVMMINGGSAVPLWNTWLDSMQENAPEAPEMTEQALQQMFQAACRDLEALSRAKVGEKTMMDTVIPATAAMTACTGDADAIFRAGAAAAREGAEATRNFVAKFGRARSYGLQTLGTPDAGATSMMYFFEGLAGL